MFSKGNNSTVVTSDFKESEFQIYEVDKTIVLRSLPNGVCDTLNVETGEYVQRIGEVVLDGSDKLIYKAIATTDEVKTMLYHIDKADAKKSSFPVSDKFITADYNNMDNHSNDKECVSSYIGSGGIKIRLLKTKVGNNGSNVKTHLQANPITVQYELATPIVSTIDLQGSPYAYKDGHIQLTSGSIEQSLSPIIEYSLPTNRNGQIRSNQKMVEKHQKELDKLQAIILANLVNSQYNQTLTTLNYELSRV